MTLTVKVQVAVLPLASVAVKLFEVEPTGKVDPLANPEVWARLPPAQLSVNVTL